MYNEQQKIVMMNNETSIPDFEKEAYIIHTPDKMICIIRQLGLNFT